jgi:hypothetical protein
MRTSITRVLLAALLSILCASGLFASPTGSITGFVKDATGTVIPGAKITLTNTATNTQITAASDTNGEFQFPQLAPFTYSLQIEAKGFKRTMVSTVVQVDQITHADVNLEVGDVSQVVEVAAVAPLLESDKSTLSSVVDTRTIASMPLNARQYLDLALITPGALPSATGTQAADSTSPARARSRTFSCSMASASSIRRSTRRSATSASPMRCRSLPCRPA